jgi:hypothetical protein
MVLSDADLEEARRQFFADTGDDPEQAPVGEPGQAQDDEDEWDDQEGGGRGGISLGALGLLAVTVFMAFL